MSDKRIFKAKSKNENIDYIYISLKCNLSENNI